MTEITVTVSGPVGCGKSAIAGEIEIALRAVGIPVRFADEKGDREEKNMTGADWTGYLEMYQPSVVIVEQIGPSPQTNMTPFIKPLEWEEPSASTNQCWVARTQFGIYSAVNEGGWYVSLDDHAWRTEYFEWSAPDARMTLSDAQAAAYADYERRVLSCLSAVVSVDAETAVHELTAGFGHRWPADYAAQIVRAVLTATATTQDPLPAKNDDIRQTTPETHKRGDLDQLREALEPFAAILDDYDPEDEDDFTPGTLVVGSITNYEITLGDLRRARAALTTEGQP